MNTPHSPDFSVNTLTGMLEPLKNTRRDKMRQWAHAPRAPRKARMGLPTNGAGNISFRDFRISPLPGYTPRRFNLEQGVSGPWNVR